MNSEPIETEVVPETALAVRQQADLPVAESKKATPQELRTVEVNQALEPAYQRAGMLDMSDAEVEALQAPFGDDLVEIRPHDDLIFIPHIHVRTRLNQVFRPGKWTVICRRHWMEGGTMYGEYVMIVRGCFVGESVGGHAYQPNNPKVNYSDALESTESEAIRRIAGKKLGCGSQVWEPEYARNWVAKYAFQDRGRWQKRQNATKTAPVASQTHQNPPEATKTQPKQQEASQSKPAAFPSASQRDKMIEQLNARPGQPDREIVTEYFRKAGAILDSEQLEDLPLRFVPATAGQMRAIGSAIAAFGNGEQAGLAFPPHKEPENLAKAPADVASQRAKAESQQKASTPIGSGVGAGSSKDESWRSFPVPFGKDAGTPLGKLEKNKLFGWWANFEVKTEYNGKAISAEKVAKDEKFREMLDAAGEHYEFTHPDDTEGEFPDSEEGQR